MANCAAICDTGRGTADEVDCGRGTPDSELTVDSGRERVTGC